MKYESNRPPVAVMLAAGMGSRLGPLTDDCPVCLLTIGGSVIIERMIRNSLSCGISQFVLVLGHKADQVRQFVDKTFRGIRVTYVINDRYRDTGTGYSLMLASSVVRTAEFIKFDANVVFDTQIFRQLTDSDMPNVLCIDRKVTLAGDEIRVATDDQMRVAGIGKSIDPETTHGTTHGTSIGIEKISATTGPLLFAELKLMMENPVSARDDCAVAYARLLEKGVPFHALDVSGLNWTAVDSSSELADANAMFSMPIKTVSRGLQRAMDDAAEKRPRSR